jgi:hypothetical protein
MVPTPWRESICNRQEVAPSMFAVTDTRPPLRGKWLGSTVSNAIEGRGDDALATMFKGIARARAKVATTATTIRR